MYVFVKTLSNVHSRMLFTSEDVTQSELHVFQNPNCSVYFPLFHKHHKLPFFYVSTGRYPSLSKHPTSHYSTKIPQFQLIAI